MDVAEAMEFVIRRDLMADKGGWTLDQFFLLTSSGREHRVDEWWGSARPIDIAAVFGLLKTRAERQPDLVPSVTTDDPMRDQIEGLLGWMKQLNRTAKRPQGQRPHTASLMFYPLLGASATPELVAERQVRLFELFVEPVRKLGYCLRDEQLPRNWSFRSEDGELLSTPQIEEFVRDTTGADSTAPNPKETSLLSLTISEQGGHLYGSVLKAVGGVVDTTITLDGQTEEEVSNILAPVLEACGVFRKVFIDRIERGSIKVILRVTGIEARKIVDAFTSGRIEEFGITHIEVLQPSAKPTIVELQTTTRPKPKRSSPTTVWTLVGRTNEEGSHGVRTFEEICRLSYYPLYGFARDRGCSHADAENLCWSFLATTSKRLEGSQVKVGGGGDPKRGGFRTYLLRSFWNYLINEREWRTTTKRSGETSTPPVGSMNTKERYRAESDISSTPPELAFDIRWANEIINKARSDLREEYQRKNKLEEYELLEGCFAMTPGSPSHDELVEATGMTKPALAKAIYHLRHRFGELLRSHIRDTLTDPSEMDAELDHLIGVLGLSSEALVDEREDDLG